MTRDLWAIRPEWAWLVKEDWTAPEAIARLSAARPGDAATRTPQTEGAIAVVPIHGPVVGNNSFAAKYFGMLTAQTIAETVNTIARAPEIGGIVLDFNGPGGKVSGATEASDAINALVQSGYPVVAHVSGEACSLHYWLASQCAAIYGERSTIAGCLGTIAVMYDDSKIYEREQIKTYVFTRSTFKAMGVAGVEITPEMVQFMEQYIDEGDALFRADVLRGRPGFDWAANADGKFWSAENARARGLLDGVQPLAASIAVAQRMAADRAQARVNLARARLL